MDVDSTVELGYDHASSSSFSAEGIPGSQNPEMNFGETHPVNCSAASPNASCSFRSVIDLNETESNADDESKFLGFDDCAENFDLSACTSELESSFNASMSADSYKNIQKFFAEQRRLASSIPIDQIELRPSAITAILRPYQSETVKWMIMRETKRRQFQLGEWCITLPPGGILADEMGLGKTVEVLACIISNAKNKIVMKSEGCNQNKSPSKPHGKRPATDVPVAAFMKKKPRLSHIKQNRTLKTEIGSLLKEHFEKFNRAVLRKRDDLSRKCQAVIDICFKVLLLHRYYNSVKLQYPKFQTWGYLVSEFSVVESDTIGYAILLKDTQTASQTLPVGLNLNEEDAAEIISIVNSYLDEKRMKKFEQEFYQKMRFGLNVSAGEFIPLLEGDEVRCSCGSDKAKGKKIKCSKCESFQHLQCVGLDQLPDDLDVYRCPICWMNEPVVESAATLIVMPSTLVQQWSDEIGKHADDCHLKVFCYLGVKSNYTLPPILASYDIVLTSFQTLRSELSFVKKETPSLRRTKRYLSFVTPLTCIHWWRLCVDEAQMVEGVNKVSEMAALIKTAHLWAITGTPVGKSLHDLYGMTTYLRMKPFTLSDDYWKVLMSGDQSLLHRLFAYLMRRKTKDEVHDQLKLPELTVDTQWLSFPPAEGFFYKSTHEQTESLFMRKIGSVRNLDQQLKKANRSTVESIMAPLLSLRQACVNPMAVVRGNVITFKKGETMQHLLEKMFKRTKVECEDALRLYIMHVNGSAGFHIRFQKFADAVALYRGLLLKTQIFNDLQPDSFQVIHVMHNMYETAIKDPTIELTEEESHFPTKIAELEKKCLEKKQEEIGVANQQLSKYTSEISNCISQFDLKHFSWWQNMLNTFDFGELIARAMEDIERDHIELTNALKLKFSTVSRLNEALKFWLADVESKRNLIFLFLEQISTLTITESLWAAADHCHIRKKKPTRSCLLCRMEALMCKYEALLFNMGKASLRTSVSSELGTANPIDWKNSAYEYVLNALLSSSRSAFGSTVDNINAGNQLKALGLLKREFKAVRAVWSRHFDLVHVYDEILMAKSTINETAEADEGANTAFHVQVSTFHEQSENAYAKLQSKYGLLKYLKFMNTDYKTGGAVEEACPVCQMVVDEKRSIMSCGHFTCYICMQQLIKVSMRDNKIPCPICRTLAPLSSISYVFGGGTCDFDTSNVIGNHAIKINAVTAKVLSLIAEDPKVKILVFTTWQRAQREIEKAFVINKISFKRFSTPALAVFKSKNDVNVLLMPLRTSNKGLNLTEASHIIFTEPVLHIADEKQAIGRIYRLGQRKSMVVHKFIIKQTVEEHIHWMNEELQKNSDAYELTFRHLLNLFEASASHLPQD